MHTPAKIVIFPHSDAAVRQNSKDTVGRFHQRGAFGVDSKTTTSMSSLEAISMSGICEENISFSSWLFNVIDIHDHFDLFSSLKDNKKECRKGTL